jgi:8-oxo-dGTP pyrophosphatase MutT (NUDIX family)
MTQIVSCGIMFNKKKQILMGKRANRGSYPGIWEFPGGKVEEGETLSDCLHREWKEELNLTISIERLLTTVTEEDTLCHFFIGEIIDLPNIQINVHDSVDFYYPHEIKKLLLFDGDEQIIDNVLVPFS